MGRVCNENMNWSKVWFAISVLGVSSLIFALGVLVGNRSFVSSTPQSLIITHWNGATANDLSQITYVTLFGRSAENEIKPVGQLSMLSHNGQIEILFKINSLPSIFSGDKPYILPKSLTIYRVSKSVDGNSYIPISVGIITLEQKDRILTGRLPLTLSLPDTQNIERFVALGDTGASDLPATGSLNFLPVNEKTKNALYLWSDVLTTASI